MTPEPGAQAPPIAGFSRALYSNWLLYVPARILIDAGEGLQLGLGERLYVPERLCLTHGHADHLLGLPGLVAARRFSKGSTEKPLEILYPAGTPEVQVVRDTVERLWSAVQFPVTWTEARPGDRIAAGRRRTIEAFRSNHGYGSLTLGWAVVEERSRLRPEFAGRSQGELERLARDGGRAALMEPYRHVLFAHSGDSMPIDPAVVEGADLLVHDATFLDVADRKWDIHASTEEAIGVARDADVRCLVLHHLSVRYPREGVSDRLRAQAQRVGFRGALWWLDEAACVMVAPGESAP